MSKRALTVTREQDFPEWYQAVVRDADMAETSPVRGCMVIKPWGYGIWERIQARARRAHQGDRPRELLFPAVHPAELHRQGGRARRRLRQGDGGRHPPPAEDRRRRADARSRRQARGAADRPADLGDDHRRRVQPLDPVAIATCRCCINQWANVVRWEMRTRLFLRTTEFLWQEGHTAHADRDEAHGRDAARCSRSIASSPRDVLAMPVIAGEKPENERFPGADNTYSIEAMMQDGKALQAGTSHYLGTNFAEAQNIQLPEPRGRQLASATRRAGACPRA